MSVIYQYKYKHDHIDVLSKCRYLKHFLFPSSLRKPLSGWQRVRRRWRRRRPKKSRIQMNFKSFWRPNRMVKKETVIFHFVRNSISSQPSQCLPFLHKTTNEWNSWHQLKRMNHLLKAKMQCDRPYCFRICTISIYINICKTNRSREKKRETRSTYLKSHPLKSYTQNMYISFRLIVILKERIDGKIDVWMARANRALGNPKTIHFDFIPYYQYIWCNIIMFLNRSLRRTVSSQVYLKWI